MKRRKPARNRPPGYFADAYTNRDPERDSLERAFARVRQREDRLTAAEIERAAQRELASIKKNRKTGKLVPFETSPPDEKRPPSIDFAARLKKHFKEPLPFTGAELLKEERRKPFVPLKPKRTFPQKTKRR